jgi:HK97 family phage portal protein
MSIAARAAKAVTWSFDPTVTPENDIIRERVLLEGGGVFTGKAVTENKALGFVPVMAAVRLRAETIGSLPLAVYRRVAGGKQVNPDHRSYSMLHDQANPEMSAMVFKETLQSHADAWGTGYAEIEYDTDGFPLYLWPLNPSGMEVYRADANTPGFSQGELVFLYTTPDGNQSRLSSRQVFRLPGLGSNGITGYSPIQMARQAIALGMAAEEFAGRFYQNDARPGIVLKLGPEFDYDEDAKKRLAEAFDATHAGLSRKHRTAVLDEGMDITTVGFPAEDAQLVEQQKWSVEQTCRVFNIPPHMLHSLERATFNNIEELGLNFVTYSLRPWLVRWEQQIKMQLLGAWPQRGEFIPDTNHFAEFNVEGLLRGKIADRMQAYWMRFQMGSISPNEIRAKENDNPIEGGDEYFRPANLNPLEMEAPEELPQMPPLTLLNGAAAVRSAKAATPEVVDRFRPLFEDVTRNLIDLERRLVMREAEKRLQTKESEATKAVVDALAELATRPVPTPQITMAEGMVKVDVHPGEPPQVTVNVPKQPSPVIRMPEPRPVKKTITHADGRKSEVTEVPA